MAVTSRCWQRTATHAHMEMCGMCFTKFFVVHRRFALIGDDIVPEDFSSIPLKSWTAIHVGAFSVGYACKVLNIKCSMPISKHKLDENGMLFFPAFVESNAFSSTSFHTSCVYTRAAIAQRDETKILKRILFHKKSVFFFSCFPRWRSTLFGCTTRDAYA